MKKNKLIIFDLDGTLYLLRGGSFNKSPLKRTVIRNAENFISDKLLVNKAEVKKILKNIIKEYGEDISIGLEKKFHINRYEYFDTVWNIPARGIVQKQKNLRKSLLNIRNRGYELVLVSDAPIVWIANVLKELEISDIFVNKIFSGEGNKRKGFGNIFSLISRKLKILPKNCVVVGDQENTDVIPAKNLGMKTIFVYSARKSSLADSNIKLISQLYGAVEKIMK